jgi:ankyrin repeat protein
MSQKRQVQVSAVELKQEHRHDEESNNKCARGANGNDQQQQEQDPGLNVDCKESMNPPPPPPQHDDPIITQFKPVNGQWELTEDNLKRIDPETGHTILHNYCRYINTTPLEMYRHLIETKGCDVNAQAKKKNIPLHYAFQSFNPNDGGDINVLIYLLSHANVNVNIKDEYNDTLLHFACDNINALPLDIFKLLIEVKGCDVNAQNNGKDTPIHTAYRCCHQYNGGDITVLAYLINQKGINGNIKGWQGCTLLHLACKYINYLPLDIFEVLIGTIGFDINAQDNCGYTPLRRALERFRPNNRYDITVLMYLFNQKDVNFNIKDRNGHTLLHLACICDPTGPRNDFTDSQDDFIDPKLDNFGKPNAENDIILCQIVEFITEKCVQWVLDETRS